MRVFLSAALAAFSLLTLAACDAAGPTSTPADLPPAQLSAAHRDVLVAAFRDVEALGERGLRPITPGAARALEAARPLTGLSPAAFSAAVSADTVTYTGVFNASAGVGYLVTVEKRQRLGAPFFLARVQWGHAVPGATGLHGIETVTLTYLSDGALQAFLNGLKTGAVSYMIAGAGSPATAFVSADEWRVALVYAPVEDRATVTYAASDGAAALVTVRDPVVTLNADGTCTVRDGGASGTVRTRYYNRGCAVAAAGAVSGTLDRTVLSGVASADGGVKTRTEYAAGSWREVTQRGGDGVVVRATTEG